MLEIEYLRPRIPKIGYPGKSCLARKSKAYHMHRLRWSRAYDQINRMFGLNVDVRFRDDYITIDTETPDITTQETEAE